MSNRSTSYHLYLPGAFFLMIRFQFSIPLLPGVLSEQILSHEPAVVM